MDVSLVGLTRRLEGGGGLDGWVAGWEGDGWNG